MISNFKYIYIRSLNGIRCQGHAKALHDGVKTSDMGETADKDTRLFCATPLFHLLIAPHSLNNISNNTTQLMDFFGGKYRLEEEIANGGCGLYFFLFQLSPTNIHSLSKAPYSSAYTPLQARKSPSSSNLPPTKTTTPTAPCARNPRYTKLSWAALESHGLCGLAARAITMSWSSISSVHP
jgi:hypothetical protein